MTDKNMSDMMDDFVKDKKEEKEEPLPKISLESVKSSLRDLKVLETISSTIDSNHGVRAIDVENINSVAVSAGVETISVEGYSIEPSKTGNKIVSVYLENVSNKLKESYIAGIETLLRGVEKLDSQKREISHILECAGNLKHDLGEGSFLGHREHKFWFKNTYSDTTSTEYLIDAPFNKRIVMDDNSSPELIELDKLILSIIRGRDIHDKKFNEGLYLLTLLSDDNLNAASVLNKVSESSSYEYSYEDKTIRDYVLLFINLAGSRMLSDIYAMIINAKVTGKYFSSELEYDENYIYSSDLGKLEGLLTNVQKLQYVLDSLHQLRLVHDVLRTILELSYRLNTVKEG